MGPSVAALLSILEPVVTVVSAALAFSEPLSNTQALGGFLVLTAVAVRRWPGRVRWRKVAAPAVA